LDIWLRPDAAPVAPQDREEILEPFIAAAGVTLAELAQSEPAVRSVFRVDFPRTFADVSASLALGTAADWVLVLSFPQDTARALAARVLEGAEPSPADDLVRDCMGEVANVIAGQAKTMLAETPYQLVLETPRVVSGAGHEIGARPSAEGLVVIFASEFGEFALQLCRQAEGASDEPGRHS
jgi:chemotaxis protein CheX